MISAAAEGDIEKVKFLTEELGIDISDYDKRTPLHLAAAEGNFEIVKHLLNKKCNPNKHDRWGNTPLHEAKLHLKKSQDETKIDEYNNIISLLTEIIDSDNDSE